MAANNRFSKPVAFNHTNPKDKKRLEHIGDQAFSTYIKKLIDADILKAEKLKRQNEASKAVREEGKKIINSGGIKIVIGG